MGLFAFRRLKRTLDAAQVAAETVPATVAVRAPTAAEQQLVDAARSAERDGVPVAPAAPAREERPRRR